MLLHKYVNYLRLQMCAASLEMQKRATTISVRSKHWCQSHRLMHAPILYRYGRIIPLHVYAKLRRPQACAALSVMQRTAAMSSIRWYQSHTFLTVPHMPAAFTTWQKHVMAYCSHTYGVLQHAQVCATVTSAFT